MRQRLGDWWRRYLGASRGARVGLAAAVALVLVAVLACATTGGFQSLRVALFASSESTASTNQPPFTSIATTTANIPGAATTSMPTATAAPARPIPQDAATLGGSVYAFDDYFGDANCCLLSGWTYHAQYGPLWTGVYTGGAASSPTSFDWRSTDRVIGIDNQPTDTVSSWTISRASAICGGFLPPDAQRTGGASNTSQGTEQRYFSASLAKTLPASAFRDIQGKPVTPGTIYVFYETDGSANVSQCALSSDERFAQRPFALS
ncbi:MAG TPA: hypothetical protein VFQ32_12345 [Ktedonobacterales bacterium]|nr:hypothetical protein [Ktedonobacterales bacterium]